MAEAKKKLDKPLLRRKSELPTDVLTQKSLETYKVQKRKNCIFIRILSQPYIRLYVSFFFQRADEFLSTPPKTDAGQNEG